MRKVAGVLAAAAALAVGGAAQALPPSTASTSSDVLAQARQQTAQARTMLIGMTISIRQGSRSVTVRATGSEVPARHLASLDMDLSQVSPMLGMEKVLMVGSSSYVHLPVLSTPAARTKGIKPWIVQDSSSAIGVDGWSERDGG